MKKITTIFFLLLITALVTFLITPTSFSAIRTVANHTVAHITLK